MRFLNHAGDEDGMNIEAKVLSVSGEHRIAFTAKHDIAAGDEMLLNYGKQFAKRHGFDGAGKVKDGKGASKKGVVRVKGQGTGKSAPIAKLTYEEEEDGADDDGDKDEEISQQATDDEDVHMDMLNDVGKDESEDDYETEGAVSDEDDSDHKGDISRQEQHIRPRRVGRMRQVRYTR